MYRKGKHKKTEKGNEKTNWNAVTAIVAIAALIITVIISSIQMERTQELFEKQFSFDSSYTLKQFKYDSTYLCEQLQLMKNEIKTNDSINAENLKLTKEAINHDDKNKAEIIPKIIFEDMKEKYWNLKLYQALLKEDDNKARIDYIFKTRLNTLSYYSISIYDLFLAFSDNPDLANQIVSIYNNVSKLYEEYIKGSFNTKTDTIIIKGATFPATFPIVLGGQKSFNDISILVGTLNEIRIAIESINGIYNYKTRDILNKELSKEITRSDILFNKIR